MKIKDLMTKDPEACLQTDSCAAAVEIMARRDCGFVPVVKEMKGRKVIGVVTDRDIALHLGRVNRPATEVSVGACMTHAPKVISPEADIEEAVRIMEEAAVHRLPAADEEGRLVGVLSLKEIAVRAEEEHGRPGAHRFEGQLAEIVEAIAASR